MNQWLAKQDFQLVHIIETLGTVAVIGFLWRIASVTSFLKGQLTLLMTNHLPHIQAEIGELRTGFINHLNNTSAEKTPRNGN